MNEHQFSIIDNASCSLSMALGILETIAAATPHNDSSLEMALFGAAHLIKIAQTDIQIALENRVEVSE